MKKKVLKGKAFKRAIETKDAARINGDIPLIVDSTELITPEMAEKLLRRNNSNRPVNWNKVEQYRKVMEEGKWKLHAQGIILDDKGNLLTGQKRLWAIIYSGEGQYMRISRGSPPDTATLIDRGTAQTSRDLAHRVTERKHSPTEGSIARGVLALKGEIKPSVDEIAECMVDHSNILEQAMKQTRGTRKTKSILMILAAICFLSNGDNAKGLFGIVSGLAEKLDQELFPIEAIKCWNRGAAFTLVMEKAMMICERETHTTTITIE